MNNGRIFCRTAGVSDYCHAGLVSSMETSAGWLKRGGSYPSGMVVPLPRRALHRSKKSATAPEIGKKFPAAPSAQPFFLPTLPNL